MTRWNNLFPEGDLDLRTELDSFVLGSFGEDPIGQPFLFRRMRRVLFLAFVLTRHIRNLLATFRARVVMEPDISLTKSLFGATK